MMNGKKDTNVVDYHIDWNTVWPCLLQSLGWDFAKYGKKAVLLLLLLLRVCNFRSAAEIC
jgi:hypothetical protein